MKRLLCFCLLCVMLVGCTAAAPETTVPETTVGPQLKAGFYVPVNEEYAAALMYIQLAEDGSGLISMMGMPRVLTWAPEGTEYGDMRLSPTAEGLVLEDYISLDFTYTGDSLPEDFLPEPPAPGLYLISSVGFNGDMSFYGAPSRDNGYLELAEDGTGVLVFEDQEYTFTLDGIIAKFKGWSMLLRDMREQDPDGTMVMGYTYDGVIKAESIAFRYWEE